MHRAHVRACSFVFAVVAVAGCASTTSGPRAISRTALRGVEVATTPDATPALGTVAVASESAVAPSLEASSEENGPTLQPGGSGAPKEVAVVDECAAQEMSACPSGSPVPVDGLSTEVPIDPPAEPAPPDRDGSDQPAVDSAPCTATVIAADIGQPLFAGPECVGEWALGQTTNFGDDADLDFVYEDVFHFQAGHWEDLGQYFEYSNCTSGLTSSGMPLDVAVQLSPGDFCLLPPIADFIDEPATGPLKGGYRGERVRQLQVALQLISPDLATDGLFGLETEIAVLTLQLANGLVTDGIAGPATFEALGLAYP